jgi:hypothetical protein
VAFVRERMGLGVVYNGEDFDEPLVFDTRAVAASESLTAHVAAWKDMFARPRESDQTRRAYAAHRELLGYPRAAWDIEDGAAARGTSLIVLRAVMLGPGGAVDVMRFACRRARVSEAVEQLRRHFVAAAEAVVGRDVTGEGDVLCSFRWEASGAL